MAVQLTTAFPSASDYGGQLGFVLAMQRAVAEAKKTGQTLITIKDPVTQQVSTQAYQLPSNYQGAMTIVPTPTNGTAKATATGSGTSVDATAGAVSWWNQTVLGFPIWAVGLVAVGLWWMKGKG